MITQQSDVPYGGSAIQAVQESIRQVRDFLRAATGNSATRIAAVNGERLTESEVTLRLLG